MSKTNGPEIAWRRGDSGATYVGAVSRGTDTIRLTGRDPILGIDVALSIPIDQIEYVGVADPAPGSGGGDGPFVLLDVPKSEPIYVRPVGATSLHVQLLARALGALTPAPTVLAQGGRT